MTRRAAAPLVVVLVAVPICVVLIALVLRGGGPGGDETKRESSVRPTVTTALSPEVHRFGEPVAAAIELTARRADLDPSTAKPTSDLDPYRTVGPVRSELHPFGALDQLRYTFTIQCLRQACLPDAQTGEFRLGTVSVAFKTPPPPGRKFRDRRLDQRGARGDWPVLKVTSWLTPDDVTSARWRSSLGELPAPTYAVSPRWLAAGLLGGAVALVLLAAGLIGAVARDVRWRRRAAPATAVEAGPLDRALELVEASRSNGDMPARRVALETLARELRLGGEGRLAADAERLAWSPATPADADVDTLLAGVRAAENGRHA